MINDSNDESIIDTTHRCSSSHPSPERSRYHTDTGSSRRCFYTFHLSTSCLSFCIHLYLCQGEEEEEEEDGLKASRGTVNEKQRSPSVRRGRGTFEEGSAVEEVPPVREARAAGAEPGVLRGAPLGTLVALGAPGHAH